MFKKSNTVLFLIFFYVLQTGRNWCTAHFDLEYKIVNLVKLIVWYLTGAEPWQLGQRNSLNTGLKPWTGQVT